MKLLLFFATIFVDMVNFAYAADVVILIPPGAGLLACYLDAPMSDDGENYPGQSTIHSPETNDVPKLSQITVVPSTSDADEESFGTGIGYADKKVREVNAQSTVENIVLEKPEPAPSMPLIPTKFDVVDMNDKLLFVIDLDTETGRNFIKEQHRIRKEYEKNLKSDIEEQEEQPKNVPPTSIKMSKRAKKHIDYHKSWPIVLTKPKVIKVKQD